MTSVDYFEASEGYTLALMSLTQSRDARQRILLEHLTRCRNDILESMQLMHRDRTADFAESKQMLHDRVERLWLTYE